MSIVYMQPLKPGTIVGAGRWPEPLDERHPVQPLV